MHTKCDWNERNLMVEPVPIFLFILYFIFIQTQYFLSILITVPAMCSAECVEQYLFFILFWGSLIRPRNHVPRNYLKGDPLKYNKLHSYVMEEDLTK